MAYKEGITVNGLHSYRNFNLTINARSIGLPTKNSIRKTIPYMSGFYDYTKLNGAVSWGERVISYTFDIVGETVEEMDKKRTEVVNWLCNMHDVDIYDDTIDEYHFRGYYDNASQSEDGEKSELTVSFICYPFMIANAEDEIALYSGIVSVQNNGQAIRPYVKTVQDCSLRIGNTVQSLQIGDETKLAMALQNGATDVEIIKANELVWPYQRPTLKDNGITFTVSEDGSITLNGTATGTAWLYLKNSAERFLPPVGVHRLGGCPNGGSGSTYRIQAYTYHGDNEPPMYSYDNGRGGFIDVRENTQYISIAIRVSQGVTVNNLVFKPSLYGATVLKWKREVL